MGASQKSIAPQPEHRPQFAGSGQLGFTPTQSPFFESQHGSYPFYGNVNQGNTFHFHHHSSPQNYEQKQCPRCSYLNPIDVAKCMNGNCKFNL
jgi:hypothetical protein